MSELSPLIEPTIDVSEPAPGAALVVLGGEHDLNTAPDVHRAMSDAITNASHLIVDISKAEFIDSSTIAALVRAKDRAQAEGKRFNLVLGTAAIVERALEVTGVLPALNTVPTVEDALAA
jgi:anti-sigma B factor antagonist